MANPGYPSEYDNAIASSSHTSIPITPNSAPHNKLSPNSASAHHTSAPRTKPKMARSESFNPSPPHRPEMHRAAHSSFQIGGDLANGSFEENGDELTTKGRKRKRLAKACSACHVSSYHRAMADDQKNKRRCDGFDPCSNCEFSSKECLYLNAQGERIPAPRTRDASTTPQRPVRDDMGRIIHPGRSGGSEDWRRGSDAGDRPGSIGKAWSTPLDVVDRDASLSVELIDRESSY